MIKALLFDVFGTVVDWRSSVTKYLRAAGETKGVTHVDWDAFSQEWRDAYTTHCRQFARALDDGSKNASHFISVDQVHYEALEALVAKYDCQGIWNAEELKEMNLIWHKLDGWPDASQGLQLLKKTFIIGTLSNGNMKLLVDMAKYADLPWDVVFSGDVFKAYKPSKFMYLGACQMLDLQPGEVAMVAAHIRDLSAAASHGLKTVYVHRQGEDAEPNPDTSFVNFIAKDFIEAATVLSEFT